MSFEIIVTFAVVIVMAALFLQGKYTFGLITMACAVVLVMTGVLTIPEAFAGFSNSSVILIAVMITMTAALQKTSFPQKISQLFRIFDSKRNGMLVAGIIIVFLIMNTVLPDMVSIALTITFLQYLPEESGVKPSKMVIPLMAIVASCVYAAPLGVGATQDFLLNTYVSGVVNDPNYLMQFGDLFKLRIPTIIVTCIYIFFMWKKMPDSATGTQAVMTSIAASVALAAGMDPRSLMAACMISGFYAFCFPSGSVTCAFAYSLGNYNPVKFLKYTLPLLGIMILVTAVTIYIVFPPFP